LLHPPGGSNSYAIAFGTAVGDRTRQLSVIGLNFDLGAERLLAAERGGEKIAVEVKSFLASASAISEFHTALGQFINYRAALRREEPDRILYLAVPDLIYNSFFQLDFPASMLQENSVKIIVYDIELEQISLWKE
jgi:hypothetical protein